MADPKKRNLNFNKGIEELPKILTRLSNYLLQGKITTQELNSLMGVCRVYLQYYELVNIQEDQQEIEEMIQDLKDRGLL